MVQRFCDGIVIFLHTRRVFSEMQNRVGQHQAEKQHRCECKSEAIQVIVEFTFCDMPHWFMAVGCQQPAFSKEQLCYIRK